MADDTRIPRPTTPEDLHRLAAVARARGLRLMQEAETVWFCSSASDPHARHYVTGVSCHCRGFMEHQRCTHHALLLSHLGWLPAVETEEAPGPEPARCPNCSGGIVVYIRACERTGWPHPDCPHCQGTGEIPTAA